jgi:hypothetical protein
MVVWGGVENGPAEKKRAIRYAHRPYALMSLRLTAFQAWLSTVIYTCLYADYKTDLTSVLVI